MLGEIAQKLGQTYEEAEQRLETAVRAVVSRAFAVTLAAANEFKDGKPVAEELLGDPKNIRFPDEVWYKTPAQVDDVTKSETEKKTSRNPIAASLAFFAGLPVHLGAAAPNIETTTLAGLWLTAPSIACSIFVPSIWVLGLFFTLFSYGWMAVRTVPTINARQWVVKRLFYAYATVFILPFLLLLLSVPFSGRLGVAPVGSFCFLLYLICNIVLFIQTAYQYRQWCITDGKEKATPNKSYRLNVFLNVGLGVTTSILALFVVCFAFDTVSPRSDDPKAEIFISRLTVLVSLFVLCQSIAFLSFRFFYRISKDEAAFQKYIPIKWMKGSVWNSAGFEEFVRLCPFAAWLIYGNLNHILFIRLHVLGSFLEIAVLSSWWSLMWWCNTFINRKHSASFFFRWLRWTLVIGSFAAQLTIHRYLRMYIY
jgi:hypothetical protein